MSQSSALTRSMQAHPCLMSFAPSLWRAEGQPRLWQSCPAVLLPRELSGIEAAATGRAGGPLCGWLSPRQDDLILCQALSGAVD